MGYTKHTDYIDDYDAYDEFFSEEGDDEYGFSESKTPTLKEITVYLKDTTLSWCEETKRYMFADNEYNLHCGNTFEILASRDPDIYVPVRIEMDMHDYYLTTGTVTIRADAKCLVGHPVRRYIDWDEYQDGIS